MVKDQKEISRDNLHGLRTRKARDQQQVFQGYRGSAGNEWLHVIIAVVLAEMRGESGSHTRQVSSISLPGYVSTRLMTLSVNNVPLTDSR